MTTDKIPISELNEETPEADLYKIMVLIMLQNEGWEITITQDILNRFDLGNKVLSVGAAEDSINMKVYQI